MGDGAALVPALLEHAPTSSSRASSGAPRPAAARRSCSRSTRRMLGWRPRDLDLAYLPFLHGKGIAQYTSDPVFQRLLDDAPPARSAGPTDAGGGPRADRARARAIPGSFWRNLALAAAARRRPALPRDLLAPVADLGRLALPARADRPADPAQGHPPPRRRAHAPSSTASTASSSPTTAAARSTARSPRSTRSRRRRGGRGPGPGAARQRRPRRRRRRSRRSRSARARC